MADAAQICAFGSLEHKLEFGFGLGLECIGFNRLYCNSRVAVGSFIITEKFSFNGN